MSFEAIRLTRLVLEPEFTVLKIVFKYVSGEIVLINQNYPIFFRLTRSKLCRNTFFFVPGETVDVDLNDNENGTYVATYTPTCDGPHQIQVKYGDEEIPQSPYRVLVLPKHDASKVKNRMSLCLLRNTAVIIYATILFLNSR